MISMTNTFHRLRWPNHLTAHPRPDALRLGQLDATMADATVSPGSAPEPEDRPAAAEEPVTAERFLTVPEVAALLGVSQKTVNRRLRAGLLRKAPLGGRIVRITATEFARFAGG